MGRFGTPGAAIALIFEFVPKWHMKGAEMADITSLVDEYALRARVAPTLIVIVIPMTGLLCWFPAFSTTQFSLAAAVSVVLMSLFSQIGRDLGRALQPKLFVTWGGQPAVQLLRCRSRLLSKETRERYRLRLESINPGIRLPSDIEEMADPDDADIRYDSVCLFLRDATRNKAAFPLVFAENVNYGFRRNVLAMKPAGIGLSVVGLIAALLATIVGMKGDAFDIPLLPFLAAILNAVMLTWWGLRINPEWVRVAAFAYAERLVGSCDSIPGAMSQPKSIAVDGLKE